MLYTNFFKRFIDMNDKIHLIHKVERMNLLIAVYSLNSYNVILFNCKYIEGSIHLILLNSF